MKRDEHQTTVYVVYPAALFDGWEVVREYDDAPVFFDTREAAIAYADARAAMNGGALVKIENWFGDTASVREVRSGAFTGRIARGERRFGERRHARTGPMSPSGDARRADRRQRMSSD